jgi:diadenosine tetraphosphate (Ap4A) HIT family hydrolase
MLHPISSKLRQNIDREHKEYQDEFCVIVKDRFPKAKVHLLVIPQSKDICFLSDLKQEQIFYMQKVAENHMQKTHPETKFRLGFHVVPSQDLLHMHIISEDFQDIDATKQAQRIVRISFSDPRYFIHPQDVFKNIDLSPERIYQLYQFLHKNENI